MQLRHSKATRSADYGGPEISNPSLISVHAERRQRCLYRRWVWVSPRFSAPQNWV